MDERKTPWIDNLIGFFSPEAACRREAWRQQLSELRGYDAGNYGRLNVAWRATNESAEFTDRNSRDVVRARARDLERNSDMANGLISAFVRNVVGHGFTLQAATGDTVLDDNIEALWREWTKKQNCDVTGQQSFDQMLRMAVRRKKVDGGILFRKCYTSGGVLPFKLQAIEVDELAFTWTTTKHKNHTVAGGIEYNQYNKPVGYWIQQYTVDGYDHPEPVYVPAKDIIFYYTKRRPSQVREFSDFAPSITRIRDANEFITAVSVKARIAACLSVFIKKAVPTANFGRNTASSGGPSVEYNGKKLTPGMITEMNAGDEIQVVEPKGTGDDATAFLKTQQRLISMGQGISYEAGSRDMSQVNYSSARQGSIEDDLTFSEEIELLTENFMTEVYETFLISAVLSGAVGIDPIKFFSDKSKYMHHKWVASPKRWIDPQKEANANKTALMTGQKTYQQICAEGGRDWKEQINDIAEAIQYAKEKGIDLGKIVYGGSAEDKQSLQANAEDSYNDEPMQGQEGDTPDETEE